VQSALYNHFSPVHFHTDNFLPRRAFSARDAIFPYIVKEQYQPPPLATPGVIRLQRREVELFQD
jgi:hypothetical protein